MFEPVDEEQKKILALIMDKKSIDYSDIEVCNSILEASLNWTEEDEVAYPALKAARVKAKYQVTAYDQG